MVRTLSLFILAAAIWLIISPFFFVFSNTAFWNSIIVGGLMLVLAAINEFSAPGNNTWASWSNAVLGLWLIGSAFYIGDVGVSFWGTLAGGIVVAALASWNISFTTLPSTPTVGMKM